MSQPEVTPARSPMPRWKKIAIAAGAFLLIAGTALKVHGVIQRKEAPPPTSSSIPAGGQGLVGEGVASPDRAESPPPQGPGIGESASPFLMYGGFSFFAGLAVGMVLRIFLKMALIVAGIAVLGIAGLNYAGVISTQAMKDLGDGASGAFVQLEQKVQGFRTDHVLVGIPSAGLAGAGLVAGLKRK